MPFFERFCRHLETSQSRREAVPVESQESDSESSSFGIVHASSSEEAPNESIESEMGVHGASDSELLKLKRRAQTEKARAAALLARAKRKSQPSEEAPLHPAAMYKPDLQPRPEVNKPGHSSLPERWRRLRVVFSWMKAWCAALGSFLQSAGPTATHCFTTTVVDDTNMTLSEAIDTDWRKSRVVSVMNMMQSLVVTCKVDEGESQRHTFLVHSPLIVLPKTTAGSIVHELRSWLVTFAGKVSARFQLFGLCSEMFSPIPIQATLICWDSLVTNLAILKYLRVMVHLKHLEDGFNILYPLLANICLLHQLGLARKSITCHYPGLWSAIVRLAHLFEMGSFRKKFRGALISEICDSYRSIPVAALPEEAKTWRQARNRVCNLFSTDGSYSLKRRRLHLKLLEWDNSDPSGRSFCHWCLGHCCRGANGEEKSRYALLQLCKHYTLLFGHGFPVPLLYRWIHGYRALQFVNVLWLAATKFFRYSVSFQRCSESQ